MCGSEREEWKKIEAPAHTHIQSLVLNDEALFTWNPAHTKKKEYCTKQSQEAEIEQKRKKLRSKSNSGINDETRIMNAR